MTAVEAAVAAALWGAAGYRLVVVVRGPTRPRTLLAVTAVAMAVTATAHFAGEQVDRIVDIPNVGSLTARLMLILSLTALRIWAGAVEHPEGRTSRARVALAVLAGAITVIAWIASPLHERTVTDHATLVQTPALLTYTIGIYLFFAWISIDLGAFSARRALGLLRSDRAAAVALATITLAATTGTVVMLAFSLHVAVNASGNPTTLFATVGRTLMPITLVALGVGILTLPLARSAAAARDLVRVTPQWRTSPDTVRLSSRSLVAPQTLLTRRLIEIQDTREATAAPDELDEHRVTTARPSRVADVIGRVASPFPVLVALIAWTAAANSPTPAAAAWWAALAVGLIVGVPFVALLLLRASGRVTDRQVVHRSQRHLLFLIALGSTAAAAAALHQLKAPAPLTTLVTVMCVLLGVMAALTHWKPSMHLAVATGAIVALTQMHGPAALLLIALLPAVAWARIRSGRHTRAQVVAGTLLGAVVPTLALALIT